VTAPVRPSGQDILGRRPSAWAVTAAWAVTVLVALAGLMLTGLEWSSLATSDAVGSVGAGAGVIAYATLGALIVRRAGNLVGWFMLAEGAANAVMASGSAYAIFGVKAHPGTLPAAAAAGTLAEAVFVLVTSGLAAIFLVFPTGRLPSPRWRPAALAGLALTGLSLASFVFSTRTVALPAPGGGPARRRPARRDLPEQAAPGGADQHRGQPAPAPGLPGQPGHAQRPAHRRAAGHDRGAARIPAPAGRGPGRRTPPDRAQPARRRPAAADRAGHPARPAGRISRRPRVHQAGHSGPEGTAQHRAG
jgi:hypothetical protein